MFDQEESELGIAIGVLFGVIALVIALVIGLAVYKVRTVAPQIEETPAVGIVWVNVEESGEIVAQVLFEKASVQLPREMVVLVDSVRAAWLENPEANVLLSCIEEDGQDGGASSAVTDQRAAAVRDALVVVGIPVERVLIRKSFRIRDDGSSTLDRVDIRVQ